MKRPSLRHAAAVLLAVTLALAGVRPTAASVSEPGFTVRSQGVDDVPWQRCWRDLTGLPPSHIGAATSMMSIDTLVESVELRLPERLAKAALLAPSGAGVPAGALLANGVPAWRVVSRDLVTGQSLVLVQGVNGCLPYPVTSIAMTPQPLERGRTAAVVIETQHMTFCRATYFGRAERCYRDGATRLVILVGVSALEEPGTYPLEVTLVSGGADVTFSVPLEVAAGHYGFQFIDPPPRLSSLMDAELMASEAAHLARWRGFRSPSRQWNLPLAPPLGPLMSISADYGDRRSYGGSVNGYHSGIDYRAWTGHPVMAPADGVVVMSEALEMRGNAVLIDHGWGLVTGYWHLSRALVQVGDTVSRGQVFAEVGNTGLSTGSHLHWEVWVNGVSVDGKQFLAPVGLEGIELSPYVGSTGAGVAQ